MSNIHTTSSAVVVTADRTANDAPYNYRTNRCLESPLRATTHRVTYKQIDRQTDRRRDGANSRSYCVAVRWAKNVKGKGKDPVSVSYTHLTLPTILRV